jgi:hypothetical protein
MSRDLEPTVATTAADVRRLRAVELLLVVLLLCIGMTRGWDAAWPFIAWRMYADGFPPPRERVSEIQLRLVGRDGRVTKVMPYAIFGHVEIQLGREVAARAFEDRPDRSAYRDALMRRLQPLLSATGAVELQGWQLAWDVQPSKLPPLDLERPSMESMLGSIDCAADRNTASSSRQGAPR